MGNQMSAEDDIASNNEQVSRQTQATMEKMVPQRVAPGMSYCAVDGLKSHYISVGVQDAAESSSGSEKNSNVVTTDTAFMAYSITKIITSIIILQLSERNLLHIDDMVSKHLSSELLLPLPSHHYLKTHGNDITIRMLLTHTSGVPNPLPLDWFFVEDTDSSHSLVEKRQQAFFNVLNQSPKLKFNPGSDHLYSNVGYWILEKVIETVTGKSYSEVFLDQIALPLGLMEGNGCLELMFDEPNSPHSSKAENNEKRKHAHAMGHSPRYSLQTFIFYLLTPKEYWAAPSTTKWSKFHRLIPHGMGYGGMKISVEGLSVILADLLKGIELLSSIESPSSSNTGKESGVLLSLVAKREMFVLGNNSPLGWATGTICVGNEQQPYLSKPGGGLGYHGNIRVYPRLGIATVFLCNGTCVSAGSINKLSDRLDLPFLAGKRAL